MRDGKREQECARKNKSEGREKSKREREPRKREKEEERERVGGQRRGITEGMSKPE